MVTLKDRFGFDIVINLKDETKRQQRRCVWGGERGLRRGVWILGICDKCICVYRCGGAYMVRWASYPASGSLI